MCVVTELGTETFCWLCCVIYSRQINIYAVKEIFVDETLLKIDSQNYWLWIAYYEPNLNVCLMMHICLGKERFFRMLSVFFKQLRNRYGRKPIFTDGARWYNDNACRWLRLYTASSIWGTELRRTLWIGSSNI